MKDHKAAASTCSIGASPSITPEKSGFADIRSEASLASRQICRPGTGKGSRVASRGVPQGAPAGRIPNSWLGRNGSIALLVSVMVFVASVRLRLADLPLERDEGEYAYAGQLILQGIPPYQLAYNMKFPGTYYAYSMILALFGQTPWAIHVGLLILNGGTTIVLFFLGRKLVGIFAAAVGASAFAVFALDHGIMGVFAHATHFVLLPALGALFVLLRAIELKRPVGYVVAGALLGTAVLMKQQSIFFAPFAAALLLWHERSHATRRWPQLLSRWLLLAAGTAVPFAVPR